MTENTKRRPNRLLLTGIAVVGAATVVAALVPLSASAAAPAAAQDGMVCTTGTVGTGQAAFALTAKPGRVTTPDGNSIYMWSYANGNGAFQYPGPVLCLHEGDAVTVTLKNALPTATSIDFVGMSDVKVNGRAATLNLATQSLSAPAAPGTSVTYTFTARKAGTFLYRSGTDPALQNQMGLHGAIVVRPALANHVYDEPDPGDHAPTTTFDKEWEFLHLLSEIDPDLHQRVEGEVKAGTAITYDLSKYRARYFMINGRSFPDTVEENFAQHLPAQPYGALVRVQPNSASSTSGPGRPDPAVVRYVNAGPVAYPFHPHSNNERVVGHDGSRAIAHDPGSGAQVDVSTDKFSLVVPAGGTMDALFSWQDVQGFATDPAAGGTGIGVPIADDRVRTDGTYWSGTPYLGALGPLAVGFSSFNQCGEYYHVAHSHALNEATNYGASMGGMLTMIRIDPPERDASGQLTNSGLAQPGCSQEG